MKELVKLLKKIDGFQYCANFGNLGDLLIAEGTRQFFRRNNITYHEYNGKNLPEKFDLVYAGGARFTSCWCNITECKELLTDKRIKTCVILPHSFNDVDELLMSLDNRHHLFCRDKNSYDYCQSLNLSANVYLSTDMAFNLNVEECTDFIHPTELNEEESKTKQQIKKGLLKLLSRGVLRASISCVMGGRKRKIAFLLREDKEKSTPYSTMLTYDISTAWHTSGKEMAYNSTMLKAFTNALKQVDVVVSDRLHVCIMAYLSGVEVYLLDNKYGKLSGVYNQSMSDKPKVHLLSKGDLTHELAQAWKMFNSPLRILRYKICEAILWMLRLHTRTIRVIRRKSSK